MQCSPRIRRAEYPAELRRAYLAQLQLAGLATRFTRALQSIAHDIVCFHGPRHKGLPEAQKGEESLIPPGMREPKPPSGEADEVRHHTKHGRLTPALGLLTVAVGVAAAQVIEGAVDEIAAEKERMAKLGPHTTHTP